MQNDQSPKPAFPLLVLLALASALGVAVAVALAGVAMLLAAPAYAAPAEVSEGTLLLHQGDGEASVSAPLVSTGVVFWVTGPIVRTRVVQTFRNPHDAWYQAVYVFALPPNSAVDRLRLQVGNRAVEGEIDERPHLLTSQLANIGPGDTVVVEIEYQQVLPDDGGRCTPLRRAV